jgi:hypothetical protein
MSNPYLAVLAPRTQIQMGRDWGFDLILAGHAAVGLTVVGGLGYIAYRAFSGGGANYDDWKTTPRTQRPGGSRGWNPNPYEIDEGAEEEDEEEDEEWMVPQQAYWDPAERLAAQSSDPARWSYGEGMGLTA